MNRTWAYLHNRLYTLTTALCLGSILLVQTQTSEGQDVPGDLSIIPLFTNNPLAMFVISNLLSEPQPEMTVPQFPQTGSWSGGTYWTLKGPPAPLPCNPFPDLPAYEIGTNQYIVDDRSVDYPAYYALAQA